MNLTGRQPYQKGAKAVSRLLRDDAKGRDCTVQIPGVCSHDPARTVGCHLRLFGFGGMGIKPHDILIIDACDCCHAVLDSRDKWADAALGFDDILRALMTTLTARCNAGLIRIGKE